MTRSEEFWDHLDRLIADSRIAIDRPKGSSHPRYPEMVYPLDYGYLEGTAAMDGGGIDVWQGSGEQKTLDAVIMTVDLRKRDVEIKLLLGCLDAEKEIIMDFLNSGARDGSAMRVLLVRRETAGSGWLRGRRSIRRFRADAVPAELLDRLLEAAVWAPSAHNRQPWRFAVLTSREAKEGLARQMGAEFRRDLLADGLLAGEVEAQVQRSHRRIVEAPAVVVVCLDVSVGDVYPDPIRQEAETLMGVQSAAMAGQNLLLAAHAEGLGAVWVCAPLFAPAAVQRALDLPEAWRPQGLILVGYPAAIPEPRPRRPVAEVTRYY